MQNSHLRASLALIEMEAAFRLVGISGFLIGSLFYFLRGEEYWPALGTGIFAWILLVCAVQIKRGAFKMLEQEIE